MPACHRRSWHVPNEEHRPPTLSEPPRVPFFSAPAPQPLKHKERLQLTREINTLLLVHVPNRHIHWEGLSGPRGGGPRLCPVFPLYPGCWGLPMGPPMPGWHLSVVLTTRLGNQSKRREPSGERMPPWKPGAAALFLPQRGRLQASLRVVLYSIRWEQRRWALDLSGWPDVLLGGPWAYVSGLFTF